MAKKKTSRGIVSAQAIERTIRVIRGQRVILDSDLAKLYGVTTGRLNEQVARNVSRFPEDFAYQLTAQEFTDLMSQIAISKVGRGGRRKLPWEIMRTFVRLRRLMATPGELVEQLTKLAETVQLHDRDIKLISQLLQQMLEKPVPPPRQIGFHSPAGRDGEK